MATSYVTKKVIIPHSTSTVCNIEVGKMKVYTNTIANTNAPNHHLYLVYLCVYCFWRNCTNSFDGCFWCVFVYERKCQKSFETIPATQTHTHNKCENAKPIVILNATHTPNSIRWRISKCSQQTRMWCFRAKYTFTVLPNVDKAFSGESYTKFVCECVCAYSYCLFVLLWV